MVADPLKQGEIGREVWGGDPKLSIKLSILPMLPFVLFILFTTFILVSIPVFHHFFVCHQLLWCNFLLRMPSVAVCTSSYAISCCLLKTFFVCHQVLFILELLRMPSVAVYYRTSSYAISCCIFKNFFVCHSSYATSSCPIIKLLHEYRLKVIKLWGCGRSDRKSGKGCAHSGGEIKKNVGVKS